MATLSNVLNGTNPASQMKDMSGVNNGSRLGESIMTPSIVFNPTQRLDNQLKTASQVMNYAASKEMAAQGRTDMRGTVMGYSDTLG